MSHQKWGVWKIKKNKFKKNGYDITLWIGDNMYIGNKEPRFYFK